MNVKIGKYIIKSDPQCMWIEEVLAEFAKCEADIKTLIAAVITGVRRTKPNYCPNCGADMRKDDFKTAIAKEIGCNPEDIKRIIP